jgi:hypothetical protein
VDLKSYQKVTQEITVAVEEPERVANMEEPLPLLEVSSTEMVHPPDVVPVVTFGLMLKSIKAGLD